MKRSSFALKTTFIGIFIAAGTACGGEAPPPKPPETPTELPDAGEAVTQPEHEGLADAGPTSSTEAAPAPAAPAALALPTSGAKMKLKSKKDLDIELKSDGTVNSSGKAVAKITGMELQDPTGKVQLKVDGDGNVTTSEGGAYAKFEGDDLTSGTTKWSIAEDGSVSSMDDKGKKTSLGKIEGVGPAKKSALVAAAFVAWGMKSPAATTSAASAKAAPAEKAASDKAAPADKKTASDKAAADKKTATPAKK